MSHVRRVKRLANDVWVAPSGSSRVEVDDNASIDTDTRDAFASQHFDGDILTEPLQMDEIESKAASQTYRRKVKKVVEVPVTRKVKVPVTTIKTVPTTNLERVKTKKTIQEPGFKWVQEQYSDYEHRPAVRMREEWVKQLVPEQYMKKVEVKRTRKVRVPCTVSKEVEVWEKVPVPTTKEVEVSGFRIDEVKGTKLVEVEGYQEVELCPRVKNTGALKIRRAQTVGGERRRRLERKMGQEIYEVEDGRVDTVDTDSDPSDIQDATLRYNGDVRIDGTERRTRAPRGNYRHTRSGRRPIAASVDLSVAGSEEGSVINARAAWGGGVARTMFGITLVSNPQGLLVTQVAPGGYGERYKMQVGDVIRNADGRPMMTLRDWRSLLGTKSTNSELRVVLLTNQGELKHLKVFLEGFDPRRYVGPKERSVLDGAGPSSVDGPLVTSFTEKSQRWAS